MKKLNKLLALCLALTMLLLCVPLTASAAESEYGPEDLRSIHGIDYNRITQKATGDSKSYPVELKMGDLTFNGELTGSHGLTYEELNKIINEVLNEKKLTVEQIQLVKALAANVGDKATEFWGAQVLEGLLSYLPLPEGLPKWTEYVGGVNDVFAIMVDGKLPTAGEYAEGRAKDLVAKAAEKAIETGFEKSKEYIKKVPWAAAKRIPLLGQMINTVKVGIEWQSNDKFDAYLKALEQKMADVNDFYSECSRRANKLAEEKGAGSYVIKFDKEKNYRTYNATFWGVPNLTMGATLSGVLEGSNTEGVAGTYTGTLWLDVELETPETFDAAIPNTYPFSLSYSIAKTEWEFAKKDPEMFFGGKETHQPTILKRSVQGDVSVTITSVSGKVDCKVVGNITSGNDETEFRFDHKWDNSCLDMIINGSNISYAKVYQYWHYTATDTENITETTHDGSETGPIGVSVGTVWKPIESSMKLTIDFGKK